jgi:hypothetical protein
MIWRAFLLALIVFAGGAGGIRAHALPGSTLTLQQEGAKVRLTVQFPLEDLVIAAPDLAALNEAKLGVALPQKLTDDLAQYLKLHLEIGQGDAPLTLTLSDARIEPSFNQHLGYFMLVVSQWDVATPTPDPASFELKYDAVMHEVRNHRATVQWLAQDGTERKIAEFGFYDAMKGIALDLRAAKQH